MRPRAPDVGVRRQRVEREAARAQARHVGDGVVDVAQPIVVGRVELDVEDPARDREVGGPQLVAARGERRPRLVRVAAPRLVHHRLRDVVALVAKALASAGERVDEGAVATPVVEDRGLRPGRRDERQELVEAQLLAVLAVPVDARGRRAVAPHALGVVALDGIHERRVGSSRQRVRGTDELGRRGARAQQQVDDARARIVRRVRLLVLAVGAVAKPRDRDPRRANASSSR